MDPEPLLQCITGHLACRDVPKGEFSLVAEGNQVVQQRGSWLQGTQDHFGFVVLVCAQEVFEIGICHLWWKKKYNLMLMYPHAIKYQMNGWNDTILTLIGKVNESYDSEVEPS